MTPEEVLAAIHRDFPEKRWSYVSSVLRSYGVEAFERERDRVQLAILKLCAGDEHKLEGYVRLAKQDYRDILYWADQPVEAKLGPDDTEMAIAALRRIGATRPKE